MAIQGKTIWITDASAGLSLQLAEQLAIRSNHVIVSGRDETTLQRLVERGGGAISRLPLDPEHSRSAERAAYLLSVMTDRLDLVIVQPEAIEASAAGPFDAMAMESVTNCVFTDAVRTIAVALPLLQRASKPQLVIIDPAVACTPHPEGIYRAPAAAIDYFAQSLTRSYTRIPIAVSAVRRPSSGEEMRLPGPAYKTVPMSELPGLVKAIESRRPVIYFPGRNSRLRKLLVWRPRRNGQEALPPNRSYL